MAIKEVKINRFDGGITKDLREQSSNKFAISKHFDNYSDNKRLIPYRGLEANETKNADIVKFLFSNNNIYGLGVVPGFARAKVYKKTGDIITGPWTEDQAVNRFGARSEKVFFEYKNYLYGWESNVRLWRHGDITGVATNETFKDIAYTNIAQPVHHPGGDTAYFFSDNRVHSLKDTTWTLDALDLLDDNLVITCGAVFGNYLAIGCKSKSLGNSVVYLWDRDSSLQGVSEIIDWGVGDLVSLKIIDGLLYGITNVGSNSSLGIRPKIHIKAYDGRTNLIQEIDVDSVTSNDHSYFATGDSIVRNNKLYFSVHSGSSANAGNFTGIWVTGRHELGSKLSTTLAYKVDTDAFSDQIQGFNFFQDYLFVAHSSDGSVDRIDNQNNYIQSSIYESYIFTDNDSSTNKKLIGVTVMTEPLPENGQIILEYKRDAESSWTTIFTTTTNDEIKHSAINIESSSFALGEFKEVQFRIESKGGSVITGFKFKFETIDNDLY